MIRPVTNTNNENRYRIIKYSGYTAVVGTVFSAVTGIKKIKITSKLTLHKTGAILAIVSMLVHIGAIKRWDKVFDSKH